jgi:hypothetical protein
MFAKTDEYVAKVGAYGTKMKWMSAKMDESAAKVYAYRTKMKWMLAVGENG